MEIFTLLEPNERVTLGLDERDLRTINSGKHSLYTVFEKILASLLRPKLNMNEEQIFQMLELSFLDSSGQLYFPYTSILKQVQYFLDKNEPSERIKTTIQNAAQDTESALGRVWDRKNMDKVRVSLSELSARIASGKDAPVVEILWSTEDSLGNRINTDVERLAKSFQSDLYKIFALCKKASGGKPTAKFKSEAEQLINKAGKKEFRDILMKYLEFYLEFEIQQEERSYTMGNGQPYTYRVYHNLSPLNSDCLKAFIWTSIPVLDSNLVLVLAKVAEKAYSKIPGKGPANAAVGNACFYALASSQSLEAVSQLSRLKLKLKQNSVLKLIDGYIEEIARESGVSKREMEDMAVQDFGLQEGIWNTQLGEYSAEIRVLGVGAVKVQWSKGGKNLKSLPASLKTEYKAELKQISDTSKEIGKTLSASRDRLDRSYIYNRTWILEKFRQYFFQHGLMSVIAKKLIWTFEVSGIEKHLFYFGDSWIDCNGEKFSLEEGAIVRLWHPIGKNLNEILAWRNFFLEKEIRQPFKQAFREVYILTEAEIHTRTYSNRMAAHILKQHQFSTLAKGRAWSYSLLGAYDDGRDSEIAKLLIPEHSLRVEFWLGELYMDDAFNEAGIWDYVGTDQVRFLDEANSPIDLTQISPLVFSEVMRDVDLFVGVASVGNDPEWTNRGNINDTQRNYWQGYSFGDLSETASIRKKVLENILPKLKIAKSCEIRDKFLVVKGKLRSYKIHLGSSNILMEPNDQYLCIVSDRSKANDQIYLPFEGDSALSAIISKAFLLAEDDKITDETITRQILG
jgi:hypothetical protein